MVDFSLKKHGVSSWGRGSLSRKQSSAGDSSSTFKSSRYQDMKVSDPELPKVSAKERSKAGTMMKRRLSVHQSNNFGAIKMDFDNMPALPSSAGDYSFASNVGNATQTSLITEDQLPDRNTSLASLNTNNRRPDQELYSSKSLRKILSNPDFKAKKFITEKLGDATAVDIDQFTSNLNDLSLEIQDEIKFNIDKSFKEILIVNKGLETATTELKVLRTKVQEMKDIMNQFVTIAEKKLQAEQAANETADLNRTSSSASLSNHSLLPPLKPTPSATKKDRTSVYILERMWNEELMTLFKNVDGAHKYITSTPGRHILLESDNWIEINPATLKPLQKVRLFILNDVVLIAAPKPSKQTELTVSRFSPLRDVTVEVQSEHELSFNFSNKQHTLYRHRDPQVFSKVIDIIRQAKDALREISQAEEDTTRKIRNSYTLLQQERTPNRDASTSPVKVHGRQRSYGGTGTPSRHRSDAQNDALLTNITRSIHVRMGSEETTEVTKRLKRLDDALEDLDLEIGRKNFDLAITKLNHIQSSLKSLYSSATFDESVMVELLSLKCSQRKTTLYTKLTNLLACETSDMTKLKSYMLNLIALNEPVDALEVFLQNRSNFINDLTLQIGIIDNVTSFITQVAIIRFQTLKKVTQQYLEVSKNLKRDYTSLLVCWCSEEVDKHFQLMERELSNSSTLSVQAIKITRKQIDELKPVGMDYVYKLDDFIRRNNNRIL
ncbi:Exo84 [Kluyveromyces lactis]|nr:Exo84 [Kluyveromyces lactis]